MNYVTALVFWGIIGLLGTFALGWFSTGYPDSYNWTKMGYVFGILVGFSGGVIVRGIYDE